MTATTTAEISDYITAEIMINGSAPVFQTNDKVTGEKVVITATEMMSRALNAAETGVSIREGVSADGRVVFEIHNGSSVYGRYIAA